MIKVRPITHIITGVANAYKRYMWKWEGLEGWEGTMQISKLRINNESLPYTHVLEYLYKGYDFGSQTSEMMINSTTGDNAKWRCGGQSTDGWGYFIFDLDNRVVPNYYSLTTAGDNSGYSDRRPLNFYLYGTLDDNNTSADQGWILLHHGTKSMIPSGNNEEFTMNISNVQSNLTIRPYSIIETTPSSKVVKNYQTYLNNNRLCWIVPISEFQDGLSNNLNIDVRTISNNYLNSTLYVVNPNRTNLFYTYCQCTSTHEGTSWEFKVDNTNLNRYYSNIQSVIQEAISAGYNYIYLSFQWENSVLSQTVADFITGYDASSKFRPISIIEVHPDPPFPYQTVQIGNQIWMAENLHEDDGGEGIKTVQSVIANGYELGPQTYYTYEAAVRIANSIDGWHLPTLAEWQELQTYFDSRAANARSTTGWQSNGTNTLGLNIQPVGRFDNYDWSSLNVVGSEANLWCYNVDTPSQGKGIFFYYWGVNNWGIDWGNYHGNSVRLVKD